MERILCNYSLADLAERQQEVCECKIENPARPAAGPPHGAGRRVAARRRRLSGQTGRRLLEAGFSPLRIGSRVSRFVPACLALLALAAGWACASPEDRPPLDENDLETVAVGQPADSILRPDEDVRERRAPEAALRGRIPRRLSGRLSGSGRVHGRRLRRRGGGRRRRGGRGVRSPAPAAGRSRRPGVVAARSAGGGLAGDARRVDDLPPRRRMGRDLDRPGGHAGQLGGDVPLPEALNSLRC